MKINKKRALIVLLFLSVGGLEIFSNAGGLFGFSCPTDKKPQCERLEELETLFTKIPEKPDFKDQDLVTPAQALALGYAKLGNYRKSQKYYEASLGIQRGGGSFTSHDYESVRLGRILEQYVYNGNHRGILKELKKNNYNEISCMSVIQLYAYLRQINHLKNLIKNTECSSVPASFALSEYNYDEIINLYRELKLLPVRKLKKRPMSASTNMATGVLYHLIRTSTATDDQLASMFEVEQDALADENSVKSASGQLVLFYAKHNKPKALEISQKYSDVNGHALAQNPTEMAFLIATHFKTETAKLYALTKFLESIVHDDSGIADKTEYEFINAQCDGFTFKDCVFSHIQQAYMRTEKDRGDKFNYLEANVLMSNYQYLRDFEKIHTDKDSAHTLKRILKVAARNKNCTKYFNGALAINLEDHKTAESYAGKNASAAFTCLVSSGEHTKYLKTKDNEEAKWFMSGLKLALIDASLHKPKMLLDYVQYVGTGINQNIEQAFIFEANRYVYGRKNPTFTEAEKLELSVILNEYITNEDNYDGDFYYRIYGRIEKFSDKQKFMGLLENISDFKTLFEERQDPNPRRSVIQKMALKIIWDIWNQNPFNPSQPSSVTICTI